MYRAIEFLPSCEFGSNIESCGPAIANTIDFSSMTLLPITTRPHHGSEVTVESELGN